MLGESTARAQSAERHASQQSACHPVLFGLFALLQIIAIHDSRVFVTVPDGSEHLIRRPER